MLTKLDLKFIKNTYSIATLYNVLCINSASGSAPSSAISQKSLSSHVLSIFPCFSRYVDSMNFTNSANESFTPLLIKWLPLTARWRSGNGAFGPCWNCEFGDCCGEDGGIGGGGWNGCCENGGANVGLQLIK